MVYPTKRGKASFLIQRKIFLEVLLLQIKNRYLKQQSKSKIMELISTYNYEFKN